MESFNAVSGYPRPFGPDTAALQQRFDEQDMVCAEVWSFDVATQRAFYHFTAAIFPAIEHTAKMNAGLTRRGGGLYGRVWFTLS